MYRCWLPVYLFALQAPVRGKKGSEEEGLDPDIGYNRPSMVPAEPSETVAGFLCISRDEKP